jgi:hypothetical protein
MKQWVEPESIKVVNVHGEGNKTDESRTRRELEQGADTLSWTVGSAREESTQPTLCATYRLLTICQTWAGCGTGVPRVAQSWGD